LNIAVKQPHNCGYCQFKESECRIQLQFCNSRTVSGTFLTSKLLQFQKFTSGDVPDRLKTGVEKGGEDRKEERREGKKGGKRRDENAPSICQVYSYNAFFGGFLSEKAFLVKRIWHKFTYSQLLAHLKQ
jgi:hypothetical protein